MFQQVKIHHNCTELQVFNQAYHCCNYSFQSIVKCYIRSEEHTSELQSRETISYAVFCLKKKKRKKEKEKKKKKKLENKRKDKQGEKTQKQRTVPSQRGQD